MLRTLVLCTFLLWCRVLSKKDESGDEFGGSLITSMRDDANLDLSTDEEYEDLRAELLAYHTALASLTSDSRRSMKTTPCWKLGGICVKHGLCTGQRFMTEVPGCKNKLEVCCFAWNQFQVSDHRDKGIGNLAMPWSNLQEFGGKGVVEKERVRPKKQKKERKNGIDANSKRRSLVLILNVDTY